MIFDKARIHAGSLCGNFSKAFSKTSAGVILSGCIVLYISLKPIKPPRHAAQIIKNPLVCRPVANNIFLIFGAPSPPQGSGISNKVSVLRNILILNAIYFM